MKERFGLRAISSIPAGETYYCQLKYHDSSGDDFTFTRKTVRISSYRGDAIRGKAETRADGVGALE